MLITCPALTSCPLIPSVPGSRRPGTCPEQDCGTVIHITIPDDAGFPPSPLTSLEQGAAAHHELVLSYEAAGFPRSRGHADRLHGDHGLADEGKRQWVTPPISPPMLTTAAPPCTTQPSSSLPWVTSAPPNEVLKNADTAYRRLRARDSLTAVSGSDRARRHSIQGSNQSHDRNL